MRLFYFRSSLLAASLFFTILLEPGSAQKEPETMLKSSSPAWLDAARTKLEAELAAKYGEAQRPRAQRGLRQAAEFWREADGDQAAFEDFVRANFAGDQKTLDAIFARYQRLLEQLDGHMQEIGREFRAQADLDLGPMLPVDEIFAAYDPAAHVSADFFENKLAFVVLLNFPLTTLEQRLNEGSQWSRRQWAEARLALRFSKRVPADVNQAVAEAQAAAASYVAQYNIWMYHLLDNRGQRLFPPNLRLLSHWNLRDQIVADYANPQDGAARQKMIQQVMERIITQSIPQVVIDNPGVDWNPFTNEVKPAAVSDGGAPAGNGTAVSGAPEPDTRYAMLLKAFAASRKLDAYSPTAPTLIARRFDEDREIPEERVRRMLAEVVSSPLVAQVAALIERRLGRPLEPYDLWYGGFRPQLPYSEQELDAAVRRKYPTAEAYQADIPNLLVKFGWSPERARQIAGNIVVDPARGSGHAMPSAMRSAKVHLRTRIEPGGMNYKGYNIAMHEMGHNVEETISMNDMDFYFLSGVPNNAFTEALAFVFQGRDLEQLGLAAPSARDRALKTLEDFWRTYEISGVALVDMAVWHWMYGHPQGTPEELKQATLRIAREIWNQYYAPVFKKKDVVLLAVYSHMIDEFLYLPDYPIGHMIAFQIEEQMRKAAGAAAGASGSEMHGVGPEFERMAKFGSLAPDLWMKNATGQPVGPEALLAATQRALQEIGQPQPKP
jgi:hypothetical protein